MQIPDEPKIPLDNYLLDLTDKEDGKENSVYLRNVEDFIEEIWGEMVTDNWKELDVRRLIRDELGVSVGVFYGYKNNRKSISIGMLYRLLILWKRYCNKTDYELQQKWDKIFNSEIYFTTHSKHQKTYLPKFITPKLCYLIGWMVGDGHLRGGDGRYLIKISEKNKQQLELILRPLIKDLFGIDVPIFIGYGRGYRIQFGNKTIYRFLSKILKVRVGEIPTIVESMNVTCKKYFLMGVFDSEGCVIKSRNRLTITQSKRSFLEYIIRLLNELDVYPNGPTFHKTKLGEWYSIRVESKKEFLKFARRVGSNHIDKSRLMKMWVIRIENNRNSRSSSSLGNFSKMAI